MLQKVILGLIRHSLTTLGGVAMAHGYGQTSDLQLIVGAAMTVIGGIWSVIEKHQTGQE